MASRFQSLTISALLCSTASAHAAGRLDVTAAPKETHLAHTPWQLQLGSRMFPIKGTTALGESVIHMWDPPLFREDLANGGFPAAAGAQHHVVWRPSSRNEGAFNHHAALGAHAGRLFAMWSNHPFGEDASGQRVMFSESSDGRKWRAPAELFPRPDQVRQRSEAGLSLVPDRWWSVNDRWFAVAYLHSRNLPKYNYPIAREVAADGTLGPIFCLRTPPPLPLLFEVLGPDDHRVTGLAAGLLKRYADTGTVSWWAQREGLPAQGVDGSNLIEPFTYHAADGTRILLMRSFGGQYNNRLYLSLPIPHGWTPPRPTDIPDSPSRSEGLTLPSGAVLLIGNQIAPYFDRSKYWDRDPLTVATSQDGFVFKHVFTVRAGAPHEWRFPGIEARNLGFAYPSAIVRDDILYVLYSVGKEDIEITEIPLSSLGL